MGKAQGVGRSESQKTCHKTVFVLGEMANPQADRFQSGDFYF
jgi:hypothetical protein